MLFVIPSYQRPEVLRTKSMALLDKFHVPRNMIHVFIVDDPKQIEDYSYLHSFGVHVHTGPLGLHHMRNHISRHFPNGAELVCLDDDIEDLVYMQEDVSIHDKKSCKRYPLKQFPQDYFLHWLQITFEWMRKYDVYMFGIYAVKNGYFMKSLSPITCDLRFCVGSFWGCINQPDVIITLEEKEDVERTIKYFNKAGHILRFNHIAPVTRYYKTHGGMQARGIDRHAAAAESARQLVATFPEHCSLYTGKKTGVHEVKLRNPLAACGRTLPIERLYWLPSEDHRL